MKLTIALFIYIFSFSAHANSEWKAIACERYDQSGADEVTVELSSLTPDEFEPEIRTGKITLLNVPLDLVVNSATGVVSMAQSDEEKKLYLTGYNEISYILNNLKDAQKTIIINCALKK